MQIPFFRQIQNSSRILIAGCGGGYDLASGIPLHLYLQSLGKYTVLANLSFSQLAESGCEAVFPNCYLIDENAANLPYFPEKHIAEWLAGPGCRAPVYAFAKTGVRPLRDAYRHLREKHRLDTVILADGGTDSLMFGDEWATGTIVEDSLSVIAANAAGFEHRYLAAVGFGVEHDLDHYTLLQNMAELTRAQAFLGAQSITAQMPEGAGFLSLTEYLNHQSSHRSIVTNGIAAAMRGSFGDIHFSLRTEGCEQFVNPLMPLYWFFRLDKLAERLPFKEQVSDSETMQEYYRLYRIHRAIHGRRAGRRDLPI